MCRQTCSHCSPGSAERSRCSSSSSSSNNDDEDDEDEDGEYDEDDEDAGVDFIEYECPHCHTSVYYDQEAFDLEEEHLCPECGRELFPNAPDEEE